MTRAVTGISMTVMLRFSANGGPTSARFMARHFEGDAAEGYLRDDSWLGNRRYLLLGYLLLGYVAPLK